MEKVEKKKPKKDHFKYKLDIWYAYLYENNLGIRKQLQNTDL